MGIEPTRLLEKLVWEWLYTTLGFAGEQVILSDQNGPGREGDYVTFKFIAETSAENALFEKELIRVNEDPNPPEYDPDNLLNIYTRRIMAVMGVQIWSKNARELHRRLSDSRELRATRLIFQPYRSAFVGASASSDLVHIGDTENQNRVVCNYNFATNSQLTEVNDRVHSFEIYGTLLKG